NLNKTGIAIQFQVDLDRLGKRSAKKSQVFLDERVHIHYFQEKSAFAGIRQHLPCKLRGALGGHHDLAREPPLLIVGDLLEQTRISHDSNEQVVEVVGYAPRHD